ncbi:MAG: hypothetical protein AB1798_08295 [Spirochaetota bacterium]
MTFKLRYAHNHPVKKMYARYSRDFTTEKYAAAAGAAEYGAACG